MILGFSGVMWSVLRFEFVDEDLSGVVRVLRVRVADLMIWLG